MNNNRSGCIYYSQTISKLRPYLHPLLQLPHSYGQHQNSLPSNPTLLASPPPLLIPLNLNKPSSWPFSQPPIPRPTTGLPPNIILLNYYCYYRNFMSIKLFTNSNIYWILIFILIHQTFVKLSNSRKIFVYGVFSLPNVAITWYLSASSKFRTL